MSFRWDKLEGVMFALNSKNQDRILIGPQKRKKIFFEKIKTTCDLLGRNAYQKKNEYKIFELQKCG